MKGKIDTAAITTIVFDLGGVVLTNDSVRKYTELMEHFGVSREGINAAWDRTWPIYRVGGMTERQFWKRFLLSAGAPKAGSGDVEYAMRIYRRHQRPLGSMLALLKRLSSDYRLAALADIGKEWIGFKSRKYGLEKIFEVIISSANSGVAKPDPRIYRLLLRALKAKPKECLFIDDKEKNLHPAEKLGMSVLLFTGQEDLERKLRSMGIPHN